MTTLEIVGTCIVSALGGGSAIAAAVRLRGQRTLNTDEKLWTRVDTLEKRIDDKDAECDRQLEAIRVQLGDCEERHSKTDREVARLRNLLRSDDDTPAFGKRKVP